jgi:hypothetical protein
MGLHEKQVIPVSRFVVVGMFSSKGYRALFCLAFPSTLKFTSWQRRHKRVCGGFDCPKRWNEKIDSFRSCFQTVLTSQFHHLSPNTDQRNCDFFGRSFASQAVIQSFRKSRKSPLAVDYLLIAQLRNDLNPLLRVDRPF